MFGPSGVLPAEKQREITNTLGVTTGASKASTTVTTPAPTPPPRPAQQPMGSSGRQAFSSAPRTQPSLIGSTTALTRKPNLQRRTLIGGVS